MENNSPASFDHEPTAHQSLSWGNVNLERGNIYVLNSKSGKPREIPIAARLGSILRSLGPKRKGLVFEMPEITLRSHFAKALRKWQGIERLDAAMDTFWTLSPLRIGHQSR